MSESVLVSAWYCYRGVRVGFLTNYINQYQVLSPFLNHIVSVL